MGKIHGRRNPLPRTSKLILKPDLYRIIFPSCEIISADHPLNNTLKDTCRKNVMTCRNGIRDGDLIQCLNLDAARMGEEIVGLERALKAWRVMIRSRSFSCVVIEDEGPSPEILCFGAAAFVSPVFVGEELASPRPGLNSRVIAAMDCGRSPLLSDAEIRFGNTYGGLDQVVLHVGWLRTLAPEAFSQVYTLMAFNYLEQHSGYRLNRLVTEIT